MWSDHREQFNLPSSGILFLKLILSEEEAENVVGDLAEDYTKKVEETGKKNSLWCWGQIVRSAASMSWEAIEAAMSVEERVSCRKEIPLGHLVFSLGLYAGSFVMALLVETAYGFDRLGKMSLQLAPVIFLWIFATSFLGVWVDVAWIRRKRLMGGLIFTILVFTGSAFMLVFALSFFLPQVPVIEATFQTNSAYASFLKSTTIYILPLAVVFLIFPLHYVISKQIELKTGPPRISRLPQKGVIKIRPSTLSLLILGCAIFSLVGTFRLFDGIKAGPYLNLFSQLIFGRSVIYFALASETLFWYSLMLKKIARDEATIPG